MYPDINYHKKEKILSIKLAKQKSVDSDINGNVVIDYDKNGQVVGIDLMKINISNFVPQRELSYLAIKQVNN